MRDLCHFRALSVRDLCHFTFHVDRGANSRPAAVISRQIGVVAWSVWSVPPPLCTQLDFDYFDSFDLEN